MSDRSPRTDLGILRDALPALHQLGPQCFCESCEAHAALSRITDELDEFAHLKSEWSFGHHRGDHLVYESEWQAFDAWQRGVRP